MALAESHPNLMVSYGIAPVWNLTRNLCVFPSSCGFDPSRRSRGILPLGSGYNRFIETTRKNTLAAH